jgi:hypothetical protein
MHSGSCGDSGMDESYHPSNRRQIQQNLPPLNFSDTIANAARVISTNGILTTIVFRGDNYG